MIAEEPRVDATRVTELAQSLENELARLIVGQKALLRDTVIALTAGGHVLLEGVPGLGKTVLVRSLGQALSMSFARIQFTPDLMPADIVGTNIIGDEDDRRINAAVEVRGRRRRCPCGPANRPRGANRGARAALCRPPGLGHPSRPD